MAFVSRKGENIYKRKDGRWEARFIKNRSSDGKAVYGYLYAKSYKEARQKLQDCIRLSAVTSNSCGTPDVDLLKDVAHDWLASIMPQVKESTGNKYRNILSNYLLPSLGSTPLNELTHSCIEMLCNDLLNTGGKQQSGLSPKTVSDVLSVMRSILKFASLHGKQVICDARSIEIKQESPQMRVLSRVEQLRLCNYLYSNMDAYNLGILTCLFTGIRVGELCALRWEDISLSEKTIQIHQTMQRIQNQPNAAKKTRIAVSSPKSACSVRTIPIPDELTDIMAAHQTSQSGYFLTNSQHRYIEPRTMQNRFQKALKKSSVSIANFHSLRHTFATRCVEVGFDVKSLSEILGHASVNITMNRYVHPSLELKKENMQKLSSLFAVK